MMKRTILAIVLCYAVLPLALFAQSLSVTTPAGGETYLIGHPARIDWTSSGLDGTVRIDLMRNGAQYAEIESGRIVTNGTTTWYPWSTIPEADDYYIRLTWNSDMSIVAFSALFAIKNSGASLTLTYPAGGETFVFGVSTVIAWNSQGLTGTLRVDLLKSYNLAEVIAYDQPVSTGNMSWSPRTGLAEGNDYAIRLTSNTGGAVKALSGEFSILSTGQPVLQVLRPGANEIFTHGDSMKIAWASQALAGTIGIKLRKGNLAYAVIAAARPVADHNYTWIIPDTLPEGSDYAIHIVSNSSGVVEAMSPGSLTIKAPPKATLTLQNPIGGETLVVGDSSLIEWASENLTGLVRIDLLKGTALAGEIIAAHPVSAGRYKWSPWASLANGNDYSVQITSNGVDSVKVTSAPFTIVRRELQVLRPVGGEMVTHGDTMRIEWTSQALSGAIRINLKQGSALRSTIASGGPVAAGSYLWHLPDSLPEAANYFIQLVSTAMPNVQAVSQGPFTIKAKVLPVELARFEVASGENGFVHLNWETASETNNFGFQVQRRLGQGEFQTIGFVAGHGSTTSRRQYQFVDRPAAVEVIHYRLRQLDLDGTAAFSAIRTVAVAPPAAFTLSRNYPNPVRLIPPSGAVVKFNFTLPAEAQVTGKIFDLTGRLLETVIAEPRRAGWHSLAWKIPATTATGIYFFQLEVAGQRLVQKFYLTK